MKKLKCLYSVSIRILTQHINPRDCEVEQFTSYFRPYIIIHITWEILGRPVYE